MNSRKRLLPALLVSAFMGLAAPQAHAQFSGFYSFGDSLSDAGYYRSYLASLGLPPAVVAQLGRFTTSPDPVWVELISRHYGFTPAPANVSGGNLFAQGGARVADPSASTPTGMAQRPVSTQITEYLARSGGAADPNALYSVWAGGNDFLQNIGAFQAGQITQAQLQSNVLAAAAAEVTQIARLRTAGARYILVAGLPDIGQTPAGLAAGAATSAAMTQLSAGYNTTLFTGLASNGIRVIPVDIFSLFADIRANAAAFGFTNTTGIACGPFPGVTTRGDSFFCLPSNFVAANANNNYLFADSVHPTGAAMRVVADFAISLLEGPMQYSLLAEAPLRTRASHVRTVADALTTGKPLAVGGIGVFASGDGATFDIDPSAAGTGIDSAVNSVTVGLTARASEAVTVGIAYGDGRGRGNFGNEAGGFRTRERAWSLFGAVRLGGFYGSGVLSNGDIDFNNVRRNIRLGNVVRTTRADTEGSNGSAHLTAGYDFRMGRFTVGPTLSFAAQSVDINGFDEEGGGSAGLRMAEQKRRSEIWSGGVRATYALGEWTPWVRVTADRERRDEARNVTATPLTMIATGSSYDVPAYAPDNKFTTASVGINGVITRRYGVSLAYFKVSGRSDTREDGVSLLLSVGF